MHLITPPSILSICYGRIFSKLMADFHLKVLITLWPHPLCCTEDKPTETSCEMTKTLLITLHFWHKICVWYLRLITEMDFHGLKLVFIFVLLCHYIQVVLHEIRDCQSAVRHRLKTIRVFEGICFKLSSPEKPNEKEKSWQQWQQRHLLPVLASWVTGDMLSKWGFPPLTMVTGYNSGWELCGSACVRLSAGLSCGWWDWNTGGTKERAGRGLRGDRC